ncbi:autotransporter outer membrane beta-barrel domain-containing protein [Succinatimonas hippei]|uniref:autotransporter outer membrane beta-barrel domain-containing protein n=2 Tax=Succinatimonas hippei TaxID=626938 RepID=UPI0026EE0EE0|nr:autotransporter outer membrane beta-barrel domain-containing protein [Succinatimonas hippei]
MLHKRKLVGGGKRLVKGAALSSFLTAVLAGASSPSFAEPLNISESIKDDDYNGTYESVSITTGDSESAVELTDDNIKVDIKTDTDSIILNSEKYGIRDEGKDNSILFTSVKDNVINITEEAGDASGDGINATKDASGSIELIAEENNRLDTTDDGIYVDSGSTSKISLTATTGDNEISAGNNGIDYRGTNEVTLKAEQGCNIIEGKETNNAGWGDGVRVEGTGKVSLIAGTNKIDVKDIGIFVKDEEGGTGKILVSASNADDETGIANNINGDTYGLHSSVTKEVAEEFSNIEIKSTVGDNFITGGASAVYNNGSGNILIQAGNLDDSGISTLANYDKPSNILIGKGDGSSEQISGSGIASDSTGTTTVEAEYNNIIYGADNGILSTNGTIDVTAGNNNIIGQYEDEKGIVHTSKTGVNVKSGTVLITGNKNRVYALTDGLSVTGEQSSVLLTGWENSVIVNDKEGEKTNGLFADNGGQIVINSLAGNIDVDIDSDGDYVYGINVGNIIGGGETTLETTKGDIKIDVFNREGIEVYGIQAKKLGHVKLDAGKNIIITTTSNVVDKLDGANVVSNIEASWGSLVELLADGFISLSSVDINASTYGLRANEEGSSVSLITKGQDENNLGLIVYSTGESSHSVYAQNGNIDITTEKGGISIGSDGVESISALYSTAQNRNSSILISSAADVLLKPNNGGVYSQNSYSAGIYNNAFSGYSSSVSVNGKNINILASSVNNVTYGVYAYASGDNSVSSVNISGNNITISSTGYQGYSYGVLSNESTVELDSSENVNINSSGYGIYAWDSVVGSNDSKIYLRTAGNNTVYGYSSAIVSNGVNADTFIQSNSGNNFITSDGTAVQAFSSGKVHLLADSVNKIESNTGIWTQSQGSVLLEAAQNDFDTEQYGIYADTSSVVNLDANTDNLIYVDEETEDKKTQKGYGNGYAVYSRNASSVTMEAGNDNQLLGAVYAHGSGTNVFIGGSEEDEDKAARENRIYSYAYISGAGDLGDDPEGAFEGKNVISALYAEGGANIELSGTSNILSTYAEYENDDQLERVVWAYNGKVGEENAKGTSISIKGYSYISTNQYDKSPNSLDIAIAAGTAVGLDEDDVNTPINLEDRAKVELTYADLVNEDGSTRHSFISGDILSAYDGLVNINPKDDSNAGINIEGNLLAGNNGIVNVDLGNEGTLTGRADDYGDAGVESLNGGHQNMTFFDPAFSSKIFSGGEVNLTMGENSRWNVTGQSWITTIETSNEAISAETPIIDLITANTDRDTNAHALTIYELKGNAVFNMSLDGDRSTSDMLYIKNAQGEYTINVKDAVTVADMYANKHTGLRFATLGAGSHASFRAITWDGGINNIEYEVDTDDYDTSTENTAYNGEMLSADKPGDDTVDTFFGSDGEPGSTTPAENADENIETQNLAANVKLAKAVVENADIETTAASDTLNTDATNYKLVAVKSSEISDGGKTVIDMSRANYANAVYMDTLNKRQGEARFVGDTDHGVWVRLRHDNIGKDDSFRTHNTMVEVGFEQRDVNDYGEFHTGFAFDYMNGQIDYHTVDGDGDIERYGVWFYTTFLGNDGQYADLVLKYGHLKNDFGFNTKSQGEHVTGDYTNEVASISAEYGWKLSNSYNYYIEPQVQLQYSYVTGADYTTSQGSKVDLDSIHSLIGRVGFRAGKDFNTETPITAYIRGDVLHEFLGDQDIYAYDNTGVMDVTYENDDTWYSAGVGLSVQSSENTYFFIEGEQVFGADNDNTYTVSGGFKHSF